MTLPCTCQYLALVDSPLSPQYALIGPLLIAALSSGACGEPALRVPSLIQPPEALPVTIDAPRCETTSRVPDELEVTRDEWELVRGCFPIDLDGTPPCDWACVTLEGGPCGNGGSYDMLVVMSPSGDRYVRAGRIALADHGLNSLHFTRSLRTERIGNQIVLVASLSVPGRPAAEHERYLLVDRRLVLDSKPNRR